MWNSSVLVPMSKFLKLRVSPVVHIAIQLCITDPIFLTLSHEFHQICYHKLKNKYFNFLLVLHFYYSLEPAGVKFNSVYDLFCNALHKAVPLTLKGTSSQVHVKAITYKQQHTSITVILVFW